MSPRVGLVLGAGGVGGGAWLVGALHALATETGWDPGSADRILGTSAGSMVGALCAAGVPPWFMVAHAAGESFEGVTDATGRPAHEADRAAGAVFRVHRGLPRPGPGSLRLGVAALVHPRRYARGAALSAWVPSGVISNEPLKDTVRRVVPEGWGPHPGLWVSTCDYATGKRVVFGRAGSPPADLADAVAASCAIPGFYCPVRIGGRRYVDGGACSMSSADVLCREDLDLVICLNPTSSRASMPVRTPAEAVRAAVRAQSGRQLAREARKLRTAGKDVVLIQPTAADLRAIGPNPMSRGRRHAVIQTAIETTTQALRAGLAERLAGLPPGEPHKVARPPGPPSTWPILLPQPAVAEPPPAAAVA